MVSPDPAKAVKDSLVAEWVTWGQTHPTWTATLHVDDDYKPVAGKPVLLVAADGNTRFAGDSWTLQDNIRRHTLRLTSVATGRDEALMVVGAAVDHILDNRPAVISRFQDVSDPLVTRDRGTGAFLASVTVPAIVRPA